MKSANPPSASRPISPAPARAMINPVFDFGFSNVALCEAAQLPAVIAGTCEIASGRGVTSGRGVPMWIGVDEAGTSMATSVLHLGAAPGVSLALVRKARIAAWTIVGLVLFAGRDIWSHRGAPARARSRPLP